MKLVKIAFFIVGIVSLYCGYSQRGSDQNYLPNYIPPSPEASSLGQYGEHPVNLFTGIPSISIPLFGIQSGNINVPIGLSYHAGGIKVEQIASRVGMGWSLNAGGVITRSAAGQNDDLGIVNLSCGSAPCKTYGYFDLPSNYSLTSTDPESDSYDSEPDPHFYNISGKSGKFFFKNRSDYIIVSKENIQINSPYDGGAFEITTDEGLVYRFEEEERTVASGCSSLILKYVSSWYLTEIVDPVNGKTVTFTYSTIPAINGHSIESKTYNNVNCFGFDPTQTCSNFTNTLDAKVLTRIDYDLGYILFETTNRLDLEDDKSYTSIKKYNSLGNLEKGYSFGTSYVQGNGTSGEKGKRLFLNNISEIGNEGLSTKLRYSFEYKNEELLPARDSKEQDVWGYFNDNNATSFKPDIYENTSAFDRSRFSLYDASYRTQVSFGADRTPNSNTIDYGTLSKITYPSKGYTVFEFEPHQIANAQIAAGIRVKSMTNYESNGTFLSRKKYDYVGGRLPGAFPQLVVPNGNGVTTFHRNRSHLGSNEGGYIGYDTVIEYQENAVGDNNGSIVYNYLNQPDVEPTYDTSIDCDNMNKYSYYPFFSWESNAIERGVLNKVTYWKKNAIQSDSPLKEIDYLYDRIEHEELKIKMGAASATSAGLQVKFAANRYVRSGRMLLNTEVETNYDDNGTSASKTTSYTYFQEYPAGIHNLALKSKKLTVVEGASIKTEYKYPFNFPASASSGAMGQMVSMHYVSPVIHEQTWRIDNSGTSLISSNVNDYAIHTQNSDQYVLPKDIYVANIAAPIPFAAVSSVNDPAVPGTLFEKRVEFLEYAYNRRPLRLKSDGLFINLKWDGFGNLVAQQKSNKNLSYWFFLPPQGWSAVKSTTSKSKDVYYNYTDPSYFPDISDIEQASYYISFWAKDGTFVVAGSQAGFINDTAPSTWTKYFFKVGGQGWGGQLTMSGSAKVSSLRLSSDLAQITTYHYDKFHRLIAISDPANTITSFEYDVFGRLMNQKDTNDDIEMANYYNFK